MAWIKTKDLMPTPGVPVQCKLRHCSSGDIQQHRLVRVVEDDCSWRTAGDLCELSYDWDVIEWESDENSEPADHQHGDQYAN